MRYLTVLLAVLLVSCSDDKGTLGEEVKKPNPDAELIFNEPLLMHGCTMEEIIVAEDRERLFEYPGLPKMPEHVLYYKETKNGWEYFITYAFRKNKLYSTSIEFEYDPYDSQAFDDDVFSSLAEKYETGKGRTFYNEDYFIRPYLHYTKIYLVYQPTSGYPNTNTGFIFNEPFLMYGYSKEEVRKAETRKEVYVHPFYGGEIPDNGLCFKENKGGLEYYIEYNFHDNDMLYSILVSFADEVSLGLFDNILSCLSEQYKMLYGEVSEDREIYKHRDYTIMCDYLYNNKIRLRYYIDKYSVQ